MVDYPLCMYHPDTGHETKANDELQAAVYAESGWLPAPEREQRPGYEPEPVTYAPVEKPKPAAKTVKKSADS